MQSLKVNIFIGAYRQLIDFIDNITFMQSSEIYFIGAYRQLLETLIKVQE